MCVRHGVDVIYHASYIDDEGMDMLEKKKTQHIVAPGINWLIATRKFLLSSWIVFHFLTYF
jgi:imidazolonepropionase-like amidohydrolase